MTDDALKQALAELGDVVRCRCDEAYRDRDLQDPDCQCDSMDAVRVVIARVEWLERERVLDAKLLADTQALLDKAVVALKTIAHLADGERVGGIARAVLTELPEVRALIRQAVDRAVRIVMDEVGYEEEDLCESCRDSLAAIREGGDD